MDSDDANLNPSKDVINVDLDEELQENPNDNFVNIHFFN